MVSGRCVAAAFRQHRYLRKSGLLKVIVHAFSSTGLRRRYGLGLRYRMSPSSRSSKPGNLHRTANPPPELAPELVQLVTDPLISLAVHALRLRAAVECVSLSSYVIAKAAGSSKNSVRDA